MRAGDSISTTLQCFATHPGNITLVQVRCLQPKYFSQNLCFEYYAMSASFIDKNGYFSTVALLTFCFVLLTFCWFGSTTFLCSDYHMKN